jgi:hypothetical protein
MESDIKPLSETFRHDGFDFRLLQRQGNAALFEKSKPTHTRPSFEVVIIQGISGWSYPNLAAAKKQLVLNIFNVC